jgi:hypothetical protein
MYNGSDSLRLLYLNTISLVSDIDQTSPEQLLSLIALRDVVLEELELQPVITDDDKRVLKHTVEYDSMLTSRLLQLKNEAAQALDRISKSRIQKQVYEQAHSHNSYFFDRRK